MTTKSNAICLSTLPKERIRPAFDDAVSEALEAMAFAELSSIALDAVRESGDDVLRAKIPLSASKGEGLLLICPKSTADRITRNIYGTPKIPPTDDTVADAMRELLNTIAGRLVRNLTDDNQMYRIGLPESCPSYPLKPITSKQIGVFVALTETDFKGWMQFILDPGAI